MHYTHAIARLPSATCAQGLTTSTLGAPDAHKTRQQFDAYISTLLGLRLTVTVLPEEAAYPDSHFVEDTAVVGPEFAVLTHPGAPSRRGETATIEPVLWRHRTVTRMGADAHMDGGDVLMVEKRFFVGLTSRTDEAGVREFAAVVEPFGYRVDAIEVSDGLHLKSIVNYVGRNTLILNEEGARNPAFAGYSPDPGQARGLRWQLAVAERHPDHPQRLPRHPGQAANRRPAHPATRHQRDQEDGWRADLSVAAVLGIQLTRCQRVVLRDVVPDRDAVLQGFR